jgi:hypothetical protein
VFKGTLFQFRIVRGENDCCLSCKRVGGIWYESECMFRENLNGGMSMSVLGIATTLSSSLAKGYDEKMSLLA